MLSSEEMIETCDRLKVYPNLLEKVKEMLDLMEKNKVDTADDFEEALIPEVRKFGREIMQTWASTEEGLLKKDLEDSNIGHHSKKNCIGTRSLGK